jgi:hypothetical protein
LLALPDTRWSEEEPLPLPSVGTVALSPLNLMLLCLGLWLRAQEREQENAPCLRETADAEHLYPCFALPMPRSGARVTDPGEHPAMIAAAGLALRFGTEFDCFTRSDGQGRSELVIRISPLRAQHSELYTLRDRDLARKPIVGT